MKLSSYWFILKFLWHIMANVCSMKLGFLCVYKSKWGMIGKGIDPQTLRGGTLQVGLDWDSS